MASARLQFVITARRQPSRSISRLLINQYYELVVCYLLLVSRVVYDRLDFVQISRLLIKKGILPYSDLHLVSSGNLMSKYADDTYLIVPASNANTCTAEVEH